MENENSMYSSTRVGKKQTLKRINNLVKEFLAIESEDVKEAGMLGYMARTMVIATLPHSKPKSHLFQRTNGDFTLTMMANPKFGLPYGSLPRLLLAWITREAKIKKSPIINLGKSFSVFLSKLNLSRSGGVRGDATRMKEQLLRLLATQISYVYKNDKQGICQADQFIVTKSFELWWNPLKDEKLSQDSMITLSQDFYEEIIDRPVPLDFRMLQALRRSPFQMDIYVWLTYRFSYLKKSSLISWSLLCYQFGANYANTPQGLRDFKREFLKSLHIVTVMYQEARVEIKKEGLLLKPAKSHVSQKQKAGEN